MTESLIQALVEMQEEEALSEARALLDGGEEPLAILEACSKAMREAASSASACSF